MSIMLVAFLFSVRTFGQFGVAPLSDPGPFDIDGRVVDVHGIGQGGIDYEGFDWVPTLFNATTGLPNAPFNGAAYIGKIFHKVDLYSDNVNDDEFGQSDKLNDDPNTWNWRSGAPPSKDDINNSLGFITQTPNGHFWFLVTGDRESTSGTSYLDIEFYQNGITKQGATCADPPVLGGTGVFCANGPHAGRTIGDLDITLQYTGGGNNASISFLQWANVGTDANPSYDYVAINPPLTAFVAVNGSSITPTPVPYGAFGNTTYDSLQFVETAIDLTSVLGDAASTNECNSIPYRSIFIKTKSSASKDAQCKDFIEPFTVSFCTDHTPPTITVTSTANTALGCNPSTATINAALDGATASDNCAGALTPSSSDGAIGSTGCARSQTRTWFVTDGCDNTATASRTVTWTFDVTPPVVTPSSTASTSLGCNPTNTVINGALGGATASDNCSGSLTPTSSDGGVGSTGCARAQTRTWLATDGCGNTATASRTVTWTFDITPPVVTASSTASTALGCNPTPATIDGALDGATASDNCSGVLTPTSSDGAVGSTGCARAQTRTWIATDGCGNTGATSRTVTWTFDVTPPVVTPSSTAATALGCNPTTATISGALNGATASDACSGVLTPTSSDGAVGSSGCARSQTRTWTATDNCGNTGTASRTVTWTYDITPPTITATSTGTLALGCNPPTAIIGGTLGDVNASDNCSIQSVTASDGTVGSTGCARSATRTWTATDGCGNTATLSRTATWTYDVLPPVVTPTSTAATALGCNPTTATIDGALGGATASDNCSGILTPTASDGAVSSDGCARLQTRTWLAVDGCGNSGYAYRTVTWTYDVTPPVVTPTSTASSSLGCNPTTATIGAALDGATANDNCSGTLTPTSSDGTVGSTGCSRSQTRTWTATDNCGNTATASRTVTWTYDVTPPSVSPTATSSTGLGCNPTTATIDGGLGGATASDICSGSLTPTSSDGPVGSTGCARAQTRTWTATDGCNNTATTSRTVTWTYDVTPPVVTPTSTAILACNPTTAAIDNALGGATATDNCSGALTPTSSDGAVGSTGCLRSQTRTFTATDGCGNTGTASHTALWTANTTAPTLGNLPTNLDINCDATLPTVAQVTATDNCGGVITASITYSQSTTAADCSTGFSSIVTRRWSVTDACGNTAAFTQTIRVRCCATTVCTLTQGAYGNSGGTICLPNGQTVNQTQIMINALTAEPSNYKVFGRQDLNRYWILRLTDVNQGVNSNIFKMLPGGSSAAVLGLDTYGVTPEYSNPTTWPVVPIPSSGNQAGRIRNILLAQTMALYFNMTIPGSGLVTIPLSCKVVLADRTCGSLNPGPQPYDTIDFTTYPAIAYILNPTHGYPGTIAGLYKLANDMLGGVTITGLTPANVSDAIDAINQAFDECKILVSTICVATKMVTVNVPAETNRQISSQHVSVSTYPNPYKDNIKFVVQSDVSGEATLEVYNMNGAKLQVVYNGYISAGAGKSIDYKVPELLRTNMIYVFRVGDKVVTGKVINIR